MIIRLSELMGKNIVNIYDGVRLGIVQDCDLTFESDSGQLREMILPKRLGFGSLRGERGGLIIPWQNIHKIGQEVIIVDMGQSQPKNRRSIF